jgi:calcineurin-like phosphoesterase family protein
MTLWFTADLHFDHANIIKLCNRPFKDVNDMNEGLITNWNELVDEDDTVYVLGDFVIGKNFSYFSGRLKGNKVFILGSHDRIPASYGAVELKILHHLPGLDKKMSITLCHYPMRSWENSHYGTWHLYGHHHGLLPPHGLSFDVGVDCSGYKPVSLERVAKLMSTLKPIVDFSKRE